MVPVSFSFYPNHQYGCPCVDACPHLGGAGLGSVVYAASTNEERFHELHLQVEGLQEGNAKLWGNIRKLREENEQLKRELKAERQKQFKQNKKEEESDGDSGQEETSRKRPKKKRGAPKGHPGWYRRTPKKADRTVHVPAPTRCHHCEGAVKARPDKSRYDHFQEDLIESRLQVVCYRHVRGRCKKCRRWVYQAGEGELLGSKIGPKVRARALFLRYHIGVSSRKVAQALAGLDLIRFTAGALLGFEREAGEKAEPLAEDVARKVSASDVVNADETHWRENGKNSNIWFHGNRDLAHFWFDKSRAGEVSRGILGPHFSGNLTTDCYAAYDAQVAGSKQKCLAHLLRTADEWRKVTPEEAGASVKFYGRVIAWCERGCRFARLRTEMSREKRKQERGWLRKEQRKLEKCRLDHEKALTLQNRIRRYTDEWLTFVDHPEVSPTNNLAERALRPLVVLRKLTYGHRTKAGAERMAAIMTVIETARRQGKGVIPFLSALFTLPPNKAVRALYARA